MMGPGQSTPRWDARSQKSPGPRPAFRRLRGYAFDPSLSTQMETALVNEVVFKVIWEPIAPRGATGDPPPPERLEKDEPPVVQPSLEDLLRPETEEDEALSLADFDDEQ